MPPSVSAMDTIVRLSHGRRRNHNAKREDLHHTNTSHRLLMRHSDPSLNEPPGVADGQAGVNTKPYGARPFTNYSQRRGTSTLQGRSRRAAATPLRKTN